MDISAGFLRAFKMQLIHLDSLRAPPQFPISSNYITPFAQHFAGTCTLQNILWETPNRTEFCGVAWSVCRGQWLRIMDHLWNVLHSRAGGKVASPRLLHPPPRVTFFSHENIVMSLQIKCHGYSVTCKNTEVCSKKIGLSLSVIACYFLPQTGS